MSSTRPLYLISTATRSARRYQMTVDHLKAWQVRLPPTVKEVVMNLSERDLVATGRHMSTKLFVFESIPQLKFSNPDTKFSVKCHSDHEKSTLNFISEDGSSRSIETNGLRVWDIQKQVADFCQQTND